MERQGKEKKEKQKKKKKKKKEKSASSTRVLPLAGVVPDLGMVLVSKAGWTYWTFLAAFTFFSSEGMQCFSSPPVACDFVHLLRSALEK